MLSLSDRTTLFLEPRLGEDASPNLGPSFPREQQGQVEQRLPGCDKTGWEGAFPPPEHMSQRRTKD